MVNAGPSLYTSCSIQGAPQKPKQKEYMKKIKIRLNKKLNPNESYVTEVELVSVRERSVLVKLDDGNVIVRKNRFIVED